MTREISSELLLLHCKDNSRGNGPASPANDEIEEGQDAMVRPYYSVVFCDNFQNDYCY